VLSSLLLQVVRCGSNFVGLGTPSSGSGMAEHGVFGDGLSLPVASAAAGAERARRQGALLHHCAGPSMNVFFTTRPCRAKESACWDWAHSGSVARLHEFIASVVICVVANAIDD